MAGAAVLGAAVGANLDTIVDFESIPIEDLPNALLAAAQQEQQRWREYNSRLLEICELVRVSQYTQAYALASGNGDSRLPIPTPILAVLREAGTLPPRRMADGYAPSNGCDYSSAIAHELSESSKMPGRIAAFTIALNEAVAGKPDKYLEAFCNAQDIGLPEEIVAGAQRLYIEKCRLSD